MEDMSAMLRLLEAIHVAAQLPEINTSFFFIPYLFSLSMEDMSPMLIPVVPFIFQHLHEKKTISCLYFIVEKLNPRSAFLMQ